MSQRNIRILNHISASVVQFDRHRRIVYANEYAAMRMGRPLDQIIGHSLGEIIAEPEVANHHWDRIQTVFTGAAPMEYEYETGRGGSPTWMHLRVTPEIADDGEVKTVLCVATDITALKRTELRLRESEDRFRAFMDHSPAVAYMVDEDGRAVYINEPMRQHFGITDADWLGKTEAERFPEDVARAMREKNRAVLDGGRPIMVLEHTPAPDGTTQVWQSYKFPFTDRAGRRFLAGMAINVTAEKRTEDALRVSEERLRLAARAADVGIWEWNVLTGEITWDAEMFRLYGVAPTPSGLVRYETWSGAVLPEDLPAQEAILQDTVHRLGSSKRVFRIRRPDGDVRHIEAAETVRTNDAGQVEWVVGTNVDVTPRKVAETALRASEQRFRAIFDSTYQYIGLLAPDGTLLEANRTALTSAGITLADVQGKPFWEAVWWRHNPRLQAQLKDGIRRAAGGEFVRFEAVHPLADGTLADIDFSVSPIRDESGRITLLVPEGRNVSALKQTELRLRESEARFQAFMDHTPAVTWIKGPDGRHQFANRNLQRLLDPSGTWIGHTDAELLPPEVAAVTEAHDREVRETRRPMQVVENVPTTDGTIHPWLVVKFPIPNPDGSVSTGGIALDLTEQRKAEEEKRLTEKRLHESLKLESLGVLAGGIAHDFNNLLTGILGYASLARMEIDAGRAGMTGSYLKNVETAAARAADLCKQMLAYAGKGQFQVSAVSLNQLVEEMGTLLQTSISKKAVLRFLFATDAPVVRVDVTQLRQVVMNLIVNASDAIGNTSGVISVSTGVIDADAKYLATIGASHLPPQQYAYLEVSDTGCGMSEETLARIFEPFFTTKAAGRGLGLSAIQGIVRGHDGWLTVYSAPGCGTTFKVLLPSSLPATAATAVPTTLDMTPGGRGRRVLVIEDEEDIRVFARKVLELAGFEVDVAEDGRDGAEQFERNPTAYHLVVSDLTMPHLDGVSAFRRVRRTRPDVPVVLMSGFSEDETTAGLGGMNLNGFLRKPFRAQELREIVMDAVGG